MNNMGGLAGRVVKAGLQPVCFEGTSLHVRSATWDRTAKKAAWKFEESMRFQLLPLTRVRSQEGAHLFDGIAFHPATAKDLEFRTLRCPKPFDRVYALTVPPNKVLGFTFHYSSVSLLFFVKEEDNHDMVVHANVEATSWKLIKGRYDLPVAEPYPFWGSAKPQWDRANSSQAMKLHERRGTTVNKTKNIARTVPSSPFLSSGKQQRYVYDMDTKSHRDGALTMELRLRDNTMAGGGRILFFNRIMLRPCAAELLTKYNGSFYVFYRTYRRVFIIFTTNMVRALIEMARFVARGGLFERAVVIQKEHDEKAELRWRTGFGKISKIKRLRDTKANSAHVRDQGLWQRSAALVMNAKFATSTMSKLVKARRGAQSAEVVQRSASSEAPYVKIPKSKEAEKRIKAALETERSHFVFAAIDEKQAPVHSQHALA